MSYGSSCFYFRILAEVHAKSDERAQPAAHSSSQVLMKTAAPCSLLHTSSQSQRSGWTLLQASSSAQLLAAVHRPPPSLPAEKLEKQEPYALGPKEEGESGFEAKLGPATACVHWGLGSRVKRPITSLVRDSLRPGSPRGF